jgi:large subunit ribosomal protein L32
VARITKEREGNGCSQEARLAHHALTLPQLEECPHCHQQKRAHHACTNCGWYNGREAVHIKAKTKPESAT